MPATADVSTNIRNLYHGKHHADRVRNLGKKGAQKQEIAAAYSEARQARKKSKRKKRGRG